MNITFILLDELHKEAPKLREDFVAGCGSIDDSDTEAVCYALTDIEEREGIDEMFTCGALAAFSFMSVPDGEDMHGASFDKYMANAWRMTSERKIIEEILGKVMGGKK